MSHTKELDLTHLSPNVAMTIIKWVYTDQVQLPQDEAFVMETLVGAEKYKLLELKEKYVNAINIELIRIYRVF